jgi:hypothetical protein
MGNCARNSQRRYGKWTILYITKFYNHVIILGISGNIFRGDNLATKLLSFQLFGDLGKRYLVKILVPLVEKIIAFDSILEVLFLYKFQ